MQIELHRHLDVSLRLSTLLELAQERGLEGQSTSLESFRRKIVLDRPLQDLTTVLGTFELFQKVLDRPGVLERVAFETVEDCYREGTRAVELRFSPAFVCHFSGLAWEDCLGGFERGMSRALKQYPEMRAGLICIASRDYGVESVERTVEFFLANRDRLIGLDLAGPEVEYPCRDFEAAFQTARQAGAPITIHAGEAAGPENVWAAIELLGARRIGHGIRSVEDPQLLQTLAQRGICLEMCPTSNYLTQAVKSIATHPLPQVLRAGVPVCINTDDPAVFGCTLPTEIEICRTQLGLSQAEIEACMTHGVSMSFLSLKN